jgi:hypothetical protein
LAGRRHVLRLDHTSEAEHALHEAEGRLTADTALRKQAAFAATQGAWYQRLGSPERAIAAFRRQGELCRRAGAESGEYLALGNVGCAQLDAGDLDAAIESLRQSTDGLRRINVPYPREFLLNDLAIALALRGDDVDILQLLRGELDSLRLRNATCGSVLAAAWHHARRADLRRAVLLAGYARSARTHATAQPWPVFSRLDQKVRERAAAEHPPEAIDAWLREGESLTESQALAMAFDEAALDGSR